jgi:hypothetical protein
MIYTFVILTVYVIMVIKPKKIFYVRMLLILELEKLKTRLPRHLMITSDIFLNCPLRMYVISVLSRTIIA